MRPWIPACAGMSGVGIRPCTGATGDVAGIGGPCRGTASRSSATQVQLLHALRYDYTKIFPYKSHFYVDDGMKFVLHTFPASLIEGRFLEVILKVERGVASCGSGS